ncbi:NAD(P)/FAD-dependent oxidoreductase [Metabacillus arenae]|nr:NAD(P)/FAD-dependent oxidoreductase [Metabacillus arenae]
MEKAAFECTIVGGGIAGLQAAIQLGRYEHNVLIIDSNEGRSTLCKNYHNILGWPDGVSGEHLREQGLKHALQYGVQRIQDKVIEISKKEQLFSLKTSNGSTFLTKTVLFATGIKENIPQWPNLKPCLGKTIYICPDCDGYEIRGKKTYVLGSGEAGANMALTLTYWTNNLIYINHTGEKINDITNRELVKKQIKYLDCKVSDVMIREEGQFKGVLLANQEQLEGDRAFLAFGGNQVLSKLAESLGAQTEKHHVVVNPRTKETSIENVWAAGDLITHSEQVTIAMGDGVQAAIWIHKRLLSKRKN